MKILLTLSILAATPAMAHSPAHGLHIPHGAYLLAIGIAVGALAVYNFVKR